MPKTDTPIMDALYFADIEKPEQVAKSIYLRGCRLERERGELMEALQRYGKRPHYSCDDCWYSCPLSPDGCCNDTLSQREVCNCGASKHNAEVDVLLARMKETI